MRGEKFLRPARSAAPPGSPPLARGKVKLNEILLRDERITPACAGKSCIKPVKNTVNGDHPRLRGEKSVPLISAFSRMGSPPLARGKVFTVTLRSVMVGITPACAGKSSARRDDTACSRDHPRLRGEKERSRGIAYMGIGSPPLARGKVTCW